MQSILGEYLPLVDLPGPVAFISAALLVAPFLVAYQNPDPEKLSAYECGFNAFDDARMKFDISFYLSRCSSSSSISRWPSCSPGRPPSSGLVISASGR